MNWYYIDGPRRVGPLNETEWAGLVRDGKIQPETLVWHEGMDHQWLPLSEIPAEESETEPPEPPEIPEEILETPEVFAARVVDLDFPVDFDRCISRAWGVFRNNFWLVVGASFLTLAMLALGAAVEIVRYVMPMALQGVILGGLASIYLRIMRGEPAVMSDLFVGFTPALFKQLALRTLVGFLLMELCLIPAAVATEMLGIVSPNFESVLGAEPQKALAVLFQTLQTTMASDPQKVLVWLLIVLTSLIPVAYFSFCWMFATPLSWIRACGSGLPCSSAVARFSNTHGGSRSSRWLPGYLDMPGCLPSESALFSRCRSIS